MPLYREENFISDLHTKYGIESNQCRLIANQVLQLNLCETEDWEDFSSKLRKTLQKAFSGMGVSIEFPEIVKDKRLIGLPDYTKAKSKEEILKYLDAIKGNNIEENLKRLFLNSQLEENRFNYFCCIYLALKSQNASALHINAFRLCYAVVLLMQEISRVALDSVIVIYAKRCTESLENASSLDVALNNHHFNYEGANRLNYLKLVYMLRLIDEDDMKGSIERSKKLLMTYCTGDDYDPRSFLEMIHYYALVNNKTFGYLEGMLRITATSVIVKIFGVSEDAARNFIQQWPISAVESFLNINKQSFKDCAPLLHVESQEAVLMAERQMERIGVFHGNMAVEGTFTEAFFENIVKPKIKNMNSAEFSQWMADQKQYYRCYYDTPSRTRLWDYCGYRGGDGDPQGEEEYAREIVEKNTLAKEIFPGFPSLNIRKWKKDVQRLHTQEEKIQKVKEIFDYRLDMIRDYNGDSKKTISVRVYVSMDRNLLYEAIVDAIRSLPLINGDAITRADYLRKEFDECVEVGDGSYEFQERISDNELMNSLRWETFNSLRYQDALLYMCLNCDNPEDVFDEITQMPSYGYYDN